MCEEIRYADTDLHCSIHKQSTKLITIQNYLNMAVGMHRMLNRLGLAAQRALTLHKLFVFDSQIDMAAHFSVPERSGV